MFYGIAGLLTPFGLPLAPLEIFAQSRRQPLAPRRPFLRFAAFGHDGKFLAQNTPLWQGSPGFFRPYSPP
jgi:hypothetical protein